MTRNRAYCPHCDRMALVDLAFAGDQNVEVCNDCDNAMLYDSLEDYLNCEGRRLKRMRGCDHDFRCRDSGSRRRDASFQCVYCGLPEDKSPEQLVDGRAVEGAKA